MKKLLLFFTLLIIGANFAYSVPAYPFPQKVTLPDGTTITVRIHGDEFFNYTLTTDGYQVVRLSDGYYYYYTPELYASPQTRSFTATQRASDPMHRTDQEKKYLSSVSSGVDYEYMRLGKQAAEVKREMMSQMNMQTRAAMTRTTAPRTELGEYIDVPRCLIILAQFQDVKFQSSHSQETFNRLLTQNGYNFNGAVGSAKNYFEDASNGQYNPEFITTPIITLPGDMADYGGNDTNGSDKGPDQMARDACAAVDAQINFKDYDGNGDGLIDQIFIFYAGYNEAEGGPDDSVWPHRWYVYPSNVTGSTVFDGLALSYYACASELKGASGTQLAGIGTFCHEFGHAIGLPDLYDTDYDTNGNGVGVYNVSIMGSGGYNSGGNIPPTYIAWERDLLGWTKLKDLSAQAGGSTVTLGSVLADNEGYFIPTYTTPEKEIFVLESRDGNKWDAPLNGTGLLIYHVDMNDYSGSALGTYNSAMNSNKLNSVRDHQRVRLVESSGSTINSYFSLPLAAYPGSSNRTSFNTGDYGFMSWDNIPPVIGITNIVNNNGTVTFTVVGESTGGHISVTAYPTMAEVTYTNGANGWSMRYKATSESEWTTVGGLTSTKEVITGLSPEVTYVVEAIPDNGTATVSAEFTTPLYVGDYIAPVMSGIKYIYSIGEGIPLNIDGLQKPTKSVVWSVGDQTFDNGIAISAPSAATFILECEIVYQDDSKEVVRREIKVQ